jgi:hypothetical protein
VGQVLNFQLLVDLAELCEAVRGHERPDASIERVAGKVGPASHRSPVPEIADRGPAWAHLAVRRS